jgi:hypothetical protein
MYVCSLRLTYRVGDMYATRRADLDGQTGSWRSAAAELRNTPAAEDRRCAAGEFA